MLGPIAPQSHATPIPPPLSGEDDEQDWAWPVMERQLRLLGELAEMGLNVARTIERHAIEHQVAERHSAGAGDAVVQPIIQDVGLAYARVSRAVRLTLMLQSQVIKDMQGLEDAYAETNGLRTDHRKADVVRIVERVIEAEHHDGDAAERLTEEAAERLDDEGRFGDLFARPLSETVARVCRDLGLEPDWPRLAEEAWARAEIEGGAAGWPLAGLKPAEAHRPTAAATPLRRPPSTPSLKAASP